MQSRKYYEAYWSQYDDVVTLNEFRKMLGGLGEVQARRLLLNKAVKSFKIRGEYHIHTLKIGQTDRGASGSDAKDDPILF